jgi:hygromycin-B 7''-O-kinase
MNGNLANLHTDAFYREHFLSLALWKPYVKQVCLRHNLNPCEDIYPGFPGTYPTFITESKVVKFFGRLYNGDTAYQTELATGELLMQDPRIPAPEILASGLLGDDGTGWNWPYLVYELIKGESIREAWDHLSSQNRLMVAEKCGEIVGFIHALPLEQSSFFQNSWQPYLDFLRFQRQKCLENQRTWKALPEHFVDLIDTYLPPVKALIDEHLPPHLIHADLTTDHLLGKVNAWQWNIHGVIDFGDAIVGSLLYELVALHIDLFHCEKALLEAFYTTYRSGSAAQYAAIFDHPDFPRLALSTCLLHQFDVFSYVFEEYPKARRLPDLQILANFLFEPGSPGLGDIQ